MLMGNQDKKKKKSFLFNNSAAHKDILCLVLLNGRNIQQIRSTLTGFSDFTGDVWPGSTEKEDDVSYKENNISPITWLKVYFALPSLCRAVDLCHLKPHSASFSHTLCGRSLHALCEPTAQRFRACFVKHLALLSPLSARAQFSLTSRGRCTPARKTLSMSLQDWSHRGDLQPCETLASLG